MSSDQNKAPQSETPSAEVVALPALSSVFDGSLAETLSAYQQKANERLTVVRDPYGRSADA